MLRFNTLMLRWWWCGVRVGWGALRLGWVCSGYRGVLPGAKAWLQLKMCLRRNAAKFVSVSHNKSQFTKKIRKTNGVRLAGTQQIDRVWFHVKKSIPKTLNNRKAGYLNETDVMKCVLGFCVAKNCHNDMYKCLGDLCRKSGWNKDVGNAEEKA